MRDLADLFIGVVAVFTIGGLLMVGYACSVYEECRTDPIKTANYEYCKDAR